MSRASHIWVLQHDGGPPAASLQALETSLRDMPLSAWICDVHRAKQSLQDGASPRMILVQHGAESAVRELSDHLTANGMTGTGLIALIDSAEPNAARRAIVAGAHDVLAWPCTTEELTARLTVHMRRHITATHSGTGAADGLIQPKTLLESLVEASVDAIVAADRKGIILLFNGGAERIYGYKAEDVIGRMNVRALYPSGGAREVGRMLRSEQYGGVGRLEPTCIEAIDAHGHTFPISLSAAWIYEHGVPTANFGIFTDLREKVRVEQQLAQTRQQLEESAKQALVAEIAGATAHELNQPLTSVMGYATLIQRKVDSVSELHRAAEIICQECERMADIVRKIGKLTKYETKSYVGAQKILDLDRASEDLVPSRRVVGSKP